MKSIIRFFVILIVGMAVFLGALLISEGMRAHDARPKTAAEQVQDNPPVSRESLFEHEEGSAL